MEKQNKTPHLQKWLVPPQNAIKEVKIAKSLWAGHTDYV